MLQSQTKETKSELPILIKVLFQIQHQLQIRLNPEIGFLQIDPSLLKLLEPLTKTLTSLATKNKEVKLSRSLPKQKQPIRDRDNNPLISQESSIQIKKKREATQRTDRRKSGKAPYLKDPLQNSPRERKLVDKMRILKPSLDSTAQTMGTNLIT